MIKAVYRKGRDKRYDEAFLVWVLKRSQGVILPLLYESRPSKHPVPTTVSLQVSDYFALSPREKGRRQEVFS